MKVFSRSAYGKTIYNAACYLEKSELLPLLLYVCSRICVCVQVWISCQVQERCNEKKKVKGFTDKVTFHSQRIKSFNATLLTSLKVKILSFSLSGFEMNCITSALLLFFVVSSLPTYPKRKSSNVLMMVWILTPISSVSHPVVADTVSSLSDKNILNHNTVPKRFSPVSSESSLMHFQA